MMSVQADPHWRGYQASETLAYPHACANCQRLMRSTRRSFKALLRLNNVIRWYAERAADASIRERGLAFTQRADARVTQLHAGTRVILGQIRACCD